MSERPVFHTKLRKYLSIRQQITIGAVWMLVFIIVVMTLQLPHKEERDLFGVMMISVFIALFLTHRIKEKPTGKFYQEIDSPENLHGEFSLGRDLSHWYGMILFLPIAIVLLATTSYLIRVFLVVGIASLLIPPIHYLALNGRFNHVITLRIEDDRRIFFQRRNQDWQPLIITDYDRISCEIRSAGRTGPAIAIAIWFSPPDRKQPSFSIPISYVRSKRYDSRVANAVMSKFFWNKCVENGYTFNNRKLAWLASRPKQA